jgi:hypothetical protein
MKKISSPMKRKTNLGDCNNIDKNGVHVLDTIGIAFDVFLTSKQPSSCKRVKEN